MRKRGKAPPFDQLVQFLYVLREQPAKLRVAILIVFHAGKIDDAAHRVHRADDVLEAVALQRLLGQRLHMRPLPQFQPVKQRQAVCVFLLGGVNVAPHALEIQRREIALVNPVDVAVVGDGDRRQARLDGAGAQFIDRRALAGVDVPRILRMHMQIQQCQNLFFDGM